MSVCRSKTTISRSVWMFWICCTTNQTNGSLSTSIFSCKQLLDMMHTDPSSPVKEMNSLAFCTSFLLMAITLEKASWRNRSRLTLILCHHTQLCMNRMYRLINAEHPSVFYWHSNSLNHLHPYKVLLTTTPVWLPRWAGTRNVKPIWIYWSKK